jgi:hypothetical protein
MPNLDGRHIGIQLAYWYLGKRNSLPLEMAPDFPFNGIPK